MTLLEASVSQRKSYCSVKEYENYESKSLLNLIVSRLITAILRFLVAGPLDGNWGSWSPWTRCSKTCGITGGSILRRTRLCNQPPPLNGGKKCIGNNTEALRACFTACPGLFSFLHSCFSIFFFLVSLMQNTRPWNIVAHFVELRNEWPEVSLTDRLFHLQWMADSVCGPHGQRAVRRAGLVPNHEADSVTTQSLLVEDKTALGTSHRRRNAS